MHALNTLISVISAGIWFLLFAMLLSLLFPGALALGMRAQGTRWIVSEPKDGKEHAVPFIGTGILGGLIGALSAVASLVLAEQWICYSKHRLCNDGQGGIMLIFTLPLFSVVCSGLLIGLEWLRLRIPGRSIWASPVRYTGSDPTANLICTVASYVFAVAMLSAVVFCATYVTI